MKFNEFRQLQPRQGRNVFVFLCEDDFLLEESRSVWQRIFDGSSQGAWTFEKYSVKEFEEIPAAKLMDDALTPSLFGQNRIVIVTNSEKLTKGRLEHLAALENIPNSSLRLVLATAARKSVDVWSKGFSVVQIDELKPDGVARWLVDRYKVGPDIARYLVDNVGTDLYQLHTEIEKLRTYVGAARPIEAKDIDVLILRSEQFGPFDLDDAMFALDYKKAAQVIGAMLDDGLEPVMLLGRIVRVWRQLFVGKSLAGKRSAKDVGMAAGVPAFKSGDFTAACKKFEWRQLATGFRLLLDADRALKSSTPNLEGYFDVMLWKLIGEPTRTGR